MENQSIDVTNENTEYEQEELETLYNLERLLESGQFELVSDKPENGKIRLIYIMNDAVESFIVFDNARLTGTYDSKFEGSVTASLTGNEKEYVMVVHQNESVFSKNVHGKSFIQLRKNRTFLGERIRIFKKY